MAMMKKTTRDAVIVAVLLGVLAIVLPGALRSFGGGGEAHRTVGAEPAQRVRATPVSRTTLASVPKAPTAVPLLSEVPSYMADRLRDPMISLLPRPPVEEPAQAALPRPGSEWPASGTSKTVPVPILTVEGVVWGGVRPQALVNGKLYDVGQMVEGAKIISIARSEVTVELGGQTMALAVAPPRVSPQRQRR